MKYITGLCERRRPSRHDLVAGEVEEGDGGRLGNPGRQQRDLSVVNVVPPEFQLVDGKSPVWFRIAINFQPILGFQILNVQISISPLPLPHNVQISTSNTRTPKAKIAKFSKKQPPQHLRLELQVDAVQLVEVEVHVLER